MIPNSPKPIRDHTFQFEVELVKFYNYLKTLMYYKITGQLLRSGTFIGSNVREATNAYSRKDFIFKI